MAGDGNEDLRGLGNSSTIVLLCTLVCLVYSLVFILKTFGQKKGCNPVAAFGISHQQIHLENACLKEKTNGIKG